MSTVIWVTIAIAVVIIWLIGVVDIFRRRMDAMHTIAWLLLVLILPFLGTLLYWILRPSDPGDLERTEAAQRSVRQERHDHGGGFGM